MSNIYIIREDREVICAYNSMEQAIAASINRLVICGYLCEEICIDNANTEITYSNGEKENVIHIEKIPVHDEGD